MAGGRRTGSRPAERRSLRHDCVDRACSTGHRMVRRHRARRIVVKPPQQYEPHRVDRPPFDRAGRCRVAVRGCTRMVGLT